MLLEIITPVKKLYSGNVKLVRVPGSNGSFEILNNHAPIISTLEKGDLKLIDEKDEETRYSINGGVVEVRNNHIIVLAESVQS